jgi:hypothetical protein
MTLEIQVQARDIHKNVYGLNRLMGCQPPHLDNCISNGHADKKKYAQIHLHSYIVVCIKNYINIQIFQNIIDKTEWLNLTLHFKLIFFRSFSSR